MDLAIISDIHGECFPLDHVVKDIRRQGIQQIVCLGDALQGGSQPKETIQRLRELQCPVVLGNADDWLLKGEETEGGEKVSEKQKEVRAWGLGQLSENDLDFVRHFQPTVELALDQDRKVLCFHGSPRSFNDVILPTTEEDSVRKFLSGFDVAFLAGGHTHTQQLRRVGNSWYINPGSVSLAYNWQRSNLETGEIRLDPWGDYAVISSDAESFGVSFHHVPFDVTELARIIQASGRPHAKDAIAAYATTN
jgi:predicted phosphodiesterase